MSKWQIFYIHILVRKPEHVLCLFVMLKGKRSAAKSGGGERGGRGATKADEGTLHGKRDDAYVISPDTNLKY